MDPLQKSVAVNQEVRREHKGRKRWGRFTNITEIQSPLRLGTDSRGAAVREQKYMICTVTIDLSFPSMKLEHIHLKSS